MAKYDITYACGHTETVQLYGKIKDRLDYIEWAKENQICHECRKADREAAKAAAAERAKANGMTEGSDKQMAWACDIIERTLNRMRQLPNHQRRLASLAFQERHADKVPALVAKGKEGARAAMDEAMEQAIADVWAKPAKWIIEHEYDVEDALASATADRLAQAL